VTATLKAASVLVCVAVLGCVRPAWSDGNTNSFREEYRLLIGQYRAGETRRVVTRLASWPRSELVRAAAQLDCFHRKDCEAAAVLHLEAAAQGFEAARHEDAATQIAAGRAILRQLAAPFPSLGPSETAKYLSAWYLAAGHLLQAYGFHGDAFASYSLALEIRPGDAVTTLARASAIEASALPDGFGGVLVDEASLLPLLGYPPGQVLASGLQQRVGDPSSPDHVQLLRFLAKEYRFVLGSHPTLLEARLRLGRVLAAGGHGADAASELRRVAEEAREPFELGLAHLCLGRLAGTPEEAAKAYRAACEADPALRPAWLGLSEALWRTHDRAAAVAALEHAFADDEGRLTSWVEYHLGRGRAFSQVLDVLRSRVVAADDGAR
jgi:tetratricopeptide (TPR) repeat protein